MQMEELRDFRNQARADGVKKRELKEKADLWPGEQKRNFEAESSNNIHH